MSVTLDMMEYANDVAAQADYVSSSEPVSWDLFEEDCSDISDWTDADAGNGVSEVSPAGQFHLYVSPAASGSYAYRYKDIGTYPTNGFTFEIRTYFDTLGVQGDNDHFQITCSLAELNVAIAMGSNGIFVQGGAPGYVWTEAGTDAVDQGVWTVWRFLIDDTDDTVDIYKDNVLVQANMDCGNIQAPQESGLTYLIQYGYTVASENHIDYIKAASGLYVPFLQCYSEATIKTQGSYSLRAIAQATESLNDTLTRTVSPTIDLTGQTQIKYGIYGGRTGSNIKIGIHDSGGTTTEHTANISSVDTWETQTWDISGVSDANKDAIDSIIITIVNADAVNTFYIDNMYAEIPGGVTFIPRIIII